MNKVYNYEECQQVIKDAFKKAVEHLENTLGNQYKMKTTKFAWEKFQDYVEQDVEFKMICDRCGKVDDEGNFQEHQDYGNICYECYEEKGSMI